MGIFDKITESLGKKAGLKVAQIGANKLITRHTPIDVFSIDKWLMKSADDLIESKYLAMSPLYAENHPEQNATIALELDYSSDP